MVLLFISMVKCSCQRSSSGTQLHVIFIFQINMLMEIGVGDTTKILFQDKKKFSVINQLFLL